MADPFPLQEIDSAQVYGRVPGVPTPVLRGRLMTCDALPRECLEWHILPRLVSPRLNSARTSVRSLCPIHDDHEPSLSISVGTEARITWRCFADCSRVRIRAVLIGRGVPAGCLPLVTREKEELLDQIRRILTEDSLDHGAKVLRALAALEGHRDLPKGAELSRLAGISGVSLATAYRARKLPVPSTHNTGTYPPAENVVKPRRSESRKNSHGAKDSHDDKRPAA